MCRWPITRNDKLRAIEEARAQQDSALKIGIIENRLEEIGGRKPGARQTRTAQYCTTQVGLAKIGPGEIGSGQIEAAKHSAT